MSVSYADAIRDYVYANDPLDLTLTQYNCVHPGLSFHLGLALVVAWNLFTSMFSACDALAMPEYNNPEPRMRPTMPLLRSDLRSSKVASLWNSSVGRNAERCASGKDESVSCPYKWVASRLHASTKERIEDAVRSVATHIDGWRGYGSPVQKPRRTWLGDRLNATFTIELANLTMPINHFMVMYMRSYGPNWEGSALNISVQGLSNNEEGEESWQELHTSTLSGIHNVATSVNYMHHADLALMRTVSDLTAIRATFTIVGGSRFQINGIALCNSPQALLTSVISTS